jgi:hypothetical protein
MPVLNREAILAAQDITIQVVSVVEWGGDVRVRSLSGAERDAFEASLAGDSAGKDRKANLENLRARLVVRCAVDETGARLFADADADALGTKSAAALDCLFEVAQALSGLSNKDVDALAKNSAAAQSGDSSSNSAPT